MTSTTVTTLLPGHVSPETAYVVTDYPWATVAWRDTFGAAVPEATRDLMDKWVRAKLAYEARRKETVTV